MWPIDFTQGGNILQEGKGFDTPSQSTCLSTVAWLIVDSSLPWECRYEVAWLPEPATRSLRARTSLKGARWDSKFLGLPWVSLELNTWIYTSASAFQAWLQMDSRSFPWWQWEVHLAFGGEEARWWSVRSSSDVCALTTCWLYSMIITQPSFVQNESRQYRVPFLEVSSEFQISPKWTSLKA